jgi:hypothetical protein
MTTGGNGDVDFLTRRRGDAEKNRNWLTRRREGAKGSLCAAGSPFQCYGIACGDLEF